MGRRFPTVWIGNDLLFEGRTGGIPHGAAHPQPPDCTKDRLAQGRVTDLTARPALVCYGAFGRLPMDKNKVHDSVQPTLRSRVLEVLAALAVIVVVILFLR